MATGSGGRTGGPALTGGRPEERAFDVTVVGGGPAGSAAAIAAARHGLRVALIERADFPRHKVCGDCLNPRCFPPLEELGVASAVEALPFAALDEVEFVNRRGAATVIPLPAGAERAVTRERFDAVLLRAAESAGVRVFGGAPVTSLTTSGNAWRCEAGGAGIRSACLIAADGRNSTVCRLLRLAPPARSRRVAIQRHVPLDERFRNRVSLRLLPDGYCGVAPVGDGRMNLCVVSAPRDPGKFRERVCAEFGVPADAEWRSIAPLERAAIAAAPAAGLFLAGDAARVLEPFTGEGIAFALRTGILAAEAARRRVQGAESARWYGRRHAALYRGRMHINRLTKLAVTVPWVGDGLLAAGALCPSLLRRLTALVVPAAPAAR